MVLERIVFFAQVCPICNQPNIYLSVFPSRIPGLERTYNTSILIVVNKYHCRRLNVERRNTWKRHLRATLMRRYQHQLDTLMTQKTSPGWRYAPTCGNVDPGNWTGTGKSENDLSSLFHFLHEAGKTFSCFLYCYRALFYIDRQIF